MKSLPAINLTGSNRLPHFLARLLILGFLVLVLVVLLSPWRQFIRGTGRVIAFDPLERRVNVEALVSGRVKHLHVVEGQHVEAGELLVEIQDNDPNLLNNLRAQKLAAQTRLNAARNRLESFEAQINQQTMAKTQALDAARQKVAAAAIASETAALNYRRISALFPKGLVSRREYEKAVQERDATAADLGAAEANVRGTENSFDAVISSIKASRDSAQSDIASAEQSLKSIEISLNQNERQMVTAPRDGIVLEVTVTDGSYLKPGDQICVIIPETESRFVEIWVDGNDMPLIQPRRIEDGETIPGSPVRLAFEGWPAVQVIGWPQLAVGTFAGEVVFVDATDDGKGRFRIVVGPSVDHVDRGDGEVEVGWPSGERWLRQGVQAKAWVMLDQVPLWFELWRQINGFPPIGTGIEENTTKTGM